MRDRAGLIAALAAQSPRSRLRVHRPYYIEGEGEKNAPGGSPDDFLKINHQTRANPPVRSRRRQRVQAHLRLRPAPP